MLGKHNLLILDEPTNHLDISSREVLEDALINYPGTLIAVSHDRYFVNKLASRRLTYINGRFADPDTADGVLELSAADRETSEEKISDVKKDYLSAKKAASEKRKKERAIQKNEEEIVLTESRIDEIAAEMSRSDMTDHVRLAELYEENEKLEERLLELYEMKEALTSSDDETAV